MKGILDVIRELREADPPLQYLGENEDVALGKFLEFSFGIWNGKERIVPTEALKLPGRPGDRSFMYRGQATHYPTCVASLFRGLDDERAIRTHITLEQIRVAELELVLGDHPFKHVADQTGFEIDYPALAQHYGINTSQLDLTSNVEIAAFFAIAHWDQIAKAFSPMERGTGVLYRFDWSAFGSGYSKFFEPVGIGPGLRPARQHAWTFRLRPGIDFQKVPHVEAIEFTHSKAESDEVFRRFQDGSWLYPPDCLASLVEKLANLPFVTMRAIRHAAQINGQPPDKIERIAEMVPILLKHEFGLDVVDSHELQPEESDLAIARNQASALSDAILKLRYGFHMVREPPSEISAS